MSTDYKKTKIDENFIIITRIVERLKHSIYKFLLNNSDTADFYFNIGTEQPLTIEVLPVALKSQT